MLPLRPSLALALTLAATSGPSAAPLTARNDHLEARWDAAAGNLSLVSLPSQRLLLRQVRFQADPRTVQLTNVVHAVFGTGPALEFTGADGTRDRVSLFPGLPFALIQSTVLNRDAEVRVVRQVRPASFTLDFGLSGAALQTLGTGGLLPPDQNPGSYVWMAVADPASRRGLVAGWLTHERGSGVLFSRREGDRVSVDAQIDYGRLRLPPGRPETLETLAVGGFDDARLGLEAWADTVARQLAIRLRPQPAGYCTWYSRPYGGASDETHLAELSTFAAQHLAPYGFSVVQIDDKWQDGVSTNGPKRNFTAAAARGPYPGGMKAPVTHLQSLGLTPGIWFMPFAGTYYDPFFKDHADWFVKREDGTPYETAWGGTCLDMTHPGARGYLSNVVHRIAQEWGYRYFKMDGLWTGTGTRQQYVNSGYKDDGIGDAVFHDPDQTNLEAYRSGLRLVRAVAGPEIFFLGCCASQNMRSYGAAFGLVDAMRIGPDNGADWKALLRGPTFGSRQYFLHGRVWYNDPDPVYVRTNVPLRQAQLITSWVALSGQLNLSSEWLPGLPAERLDLLRRSLPGHGLLPRPVDLFDHEPPRIWRLTDTRREPRRDVVGLFNWTDTELALDETLDRLGLDSRTEYVAYDYWSQSLLPTVQGRLRVTVPERSCRILALRPRADHPFVLSTSRHVTQGIVDLLEERWDAGNRILHGRSRVVGGDPYELRVAGVGRDASATVGCSPGDAAAGVKATLAAGDGLVRVRVESPASREVSWTLRFP